MREVYKVYNTKFYKQPMQSVNTAKELLFVIIS